MDDVLRAWRLPPELLYLKEDEVHVWGVQLTYLSANIQEFYDQLARDERRRAERFHFERDRANFIIARGVLRDILSRYLFCRPDQICFDYGPQGKPALHTSHGAASLEFNVSHSNEMALYAVTRGREVGLDIEYVREDLASEEIAQRFFSARELTALRSLPRGVWTRGFFNCWTRKEAYIKATSKGLTQSLSSFSVSLDPEAPPALTWVEGDSEEAERWSIREIIIDPCYTAAVAARGSDWTLQCWRWCK